MNFRMACKESAFNFFYVFIDVLLNLGMISIFN